MPRMKLYIEGSAAMLGWPGSASGAVEHRAGAVFCVSTAMLWNISDLFSLGALFLILFWMKILTLNCRAKPIDHQDVIFALGWPCPQLPQSWKFTLKRCYELGRHSAFFFRSMCLPVYMQSVSVNQLLIAICESIRLQLWAWKIVRLPWILPGPALSTSALVTFPDSVPRLFKMLSDSYCEVFKCDKVVDIVGICCNKMVDELGINSLWDL